MQIFGKIQEYRQNKLEGKENGIPVFLSSLHKIIPYLNQGEYNCITANSSIGKTTFAKLLLAFEPVKWVLDNPDKGWDIKVLWYALEENRDEFDLSLIQYLLHTYKGIRIDQNELQSSYQPLSNSTLNAIQEIQPIFNAFMEKISVFDDILNPTGILYSARKEICKLGSYYDENGNPVKSNEKGLPEAEKCNFRYYNPNTLVLIVPDHVSNLETEKEDNVKLNLHDTMRKWSTYARKALNKNFNASVWNIHQQASAQEGVDNFKLSKVEPSLNGLGDNKLIGRDYQRVLGLFSPYRYEQEKHNGYDIKKLKDNYRSINIPKNRAGRANVKLPCYFDPIGYAMMPLPHPQEEKELQKYY